MLFLRQSWFLTVTLSLLVGSGCSDAAREGARKPSSTHDHSHAEHDHGPQSLKDAIVELTTLRDTIQDSFAKNDQDAAHGPLHRVGEVLEAIPKLSATENLGAEQQAAIETLVTTLMDAFGRVDKTMHGQEGSTYAEESTTIDTALTALMTACKPGAPATSTDPAPAAGKAPGEEQKSGAPAPEEGAKDDANAPK